MYLIANSISSHAMSIIIKSTFQETKGWRIKVEEIALMLQPGKILMLIIEFFMFTLLIFSFLAIPL